MSEDGGRDGPRGNGKIDKEGQECANASVLVINSHSQKKNKRDSGDRVR